MNRLEEVKMQIEKLECGLMEIVNHDFENELKEPTKEIILSFVDSEAEMKEILSSEEKTDVLIKAIVNEMQNFILEKEKILMSQNETYVPKSLYRIKTIEAARVHLKARYEGFKGRNYKVFATLENAEAGEKLKKIGQEEGYASVASWPDLNPDYPEDYKFANIQNRIFTLKMQNGDIDFLIVGSETKYRWDLIDENVKLVIINSSDEEEFIKEVGIFRKDLDIIIHDNDEKEQFQ